MSFISSDQGNPTNVPTGGAANIYMLPLGEVKVDSYYVQVGAEVTRGATSITLKTGDGDKVSAGHVLYNPSDISREKFIVTNVTGDTLTVVPAADGSASRVIPANYPLKFAGYAIQVSDDILANGTEIPVDTGTGTDTELATLTGIESRIGLLARRSSDKPKEILFLKSVSEDSFGAFTFTVDRDFTGEGNSGAIADDEWLFILCENFYDPRSTESANGLPRWYQVGYTEDATLTFPEGKIELNQATLGLVEVLRGTEELQLDVAVTNPETYFSLQEDVHSMAVDTRLDRKRPIGKGYLQAVPKVVVYYEPIDRKYNEGYLFVGTDMAERNRSTTDADQNTMDVELRAVPSNAFGGRKGVVYDKNLIGV